jgi:hypothetical protein
MRKQTSPQVNEISKWILTSNIYTTKAHSECNLKTPPEAMDANPSRFIKKW